MKKILLTVLASVWIMMSPVFVANSQTNFKHDAIVSCTNFGLPNSDQCFESMNPEDPTQKLRLYLGSTKAVSFADTFTNQENYPQFLFPNGDPSGYEGLKFDFVPLQGSRWTTPHNSTNGESLWDAFEYPSGLKVWTLGGANYIFFDPNVKDVQFIRMKAGRGSRFMGFEWADGWRQADRNKPLLRFTFTTRAFGSRKLEDGRWQLSRSMVSDHKEHVFVYGAWCGDGVLDRVHGEEQDDGVNNGKPGYASTDCKKRPTPTNGSCEPSIDTTRPVSSAPTGNLCKTGVSTPVIEKDGKFTWTCQGANDGVSASCEVPKIPTVPGVCDSVKIQWPVSSAPTGNLCKTGTQSEVKEVNGKFVWTCGGIAGGPTASCEVPKKPEPQPMCGDGIVQADRGEICDLGSNNGKIVNGVVACTLECTPPTPDITQACDQTFHKEIRLGKYYGFSDYYTNNNSHAHTLNSFKVSFKESDDMNKDGKLTYDNFEWAHPFTAGTTIPGGTKDLKIITASPLYHLNTAPAVRKKDNIYIEYTVNGRGQSNFTHKECITYEVTWCGDGVLDTKEGEICDPNDPKKTGWGPNGCDVTCKPKQGTPLDLSIKKYIETDDAQPNAPVEKDSSSNFNYKIKVKVESGEATGKTTVRDILPAGIELNGNATGDTWTCAYANNTRLLECSSLATIKSGVFFADINVPVRITAQPGSTVRNDATVYNPNEKEKPCHENNANITGNEKSGGTPTCEKDPKNTDPAVFKTKHVNDLRIKKYVFNTETQKDGQIVGDALSVDYNSEFAYKYVVTASGSSDQKKVTITDKAPLGVKFTGFEKVPAGWVCNNGQVTDNGSVHHTAICQIPAMAKNTTAEIIVKAQLVNEAEFKKFNLPQEVFSRGLRNVAYVCSEEVKSVNPQTGKEEVKLCQPGCVDPNNPKCTPIPPPPVCSDIPGHPHYDPACIIIESPELAIKKFVKGQDAQTARQQVSIKIGEEYPYTFEVTNTSRVDAKGAVVVDPIPANIQIVKTGEGTGWKCTQEGQLMTCKYDGTIKAGAKAPTITAIAKIRDNVVAGTSIRNVSAVCLANDPACITTNNKCKEGDVNCLPTVRDECKPGDINYDPKTRKCDPATVVLEKPELAIKKFVKGQDAQTARDQVAVGLGEEYPYTLEVTNISQSDADGAVVVDPVPANIQIVKTGEGNGWNCTQEGQLMTCKYDGTIKAGAKAPTITAIAKIRDTAKVGTSIRNVAAVCLKNDPACITTDNKCKEGDVNCLPTVRDECKPGDVNYNPTTNKCDPATVTIAELEIKKAVNNDDAQTADKAVAVTKGTPHIYTFRVTNPNTAPVKGAKITDTFPAELEIIKVTAAGTGWTCEHNGQKVACIYNTEIKAGEVLPIVSVEAKIRENVTTTTPIRNVVGVCISDPTKSINDPAQCTPDESKCDVNHPKYDVNTKTCDPAHVVLDELDLSIKKYIETIIPKTATYPASITDAQPDEKHTTMSHGTTFNYVITVKVETGKATGITTVTDVLPNDVEPIDIATGDGWNIVWNGRAMTATSTREVSATGTFPRITIPVRVRVTAGSGNSVRNDAFVHNPNEKPKSCYDDNRIPNGNEGHNKSATDKTAICTKDPNNSDPAVFTTPTPPPTSTQTGYIRAVCNGEVAEIRSYSSISSCEASLPANATDEQKRKYSACYVDNATNWSTVRSEANRITALYCATQPVNPYCGDGIVNSYNHNGKTIVEQCDPGTGRGADIKTARADSAQCSATCDLKFNPTTNPGENAMNFYISIPGFAKTLGSTTFRTGNKLFDTNKMIVGKDSNIFTLGDEVNLVFNSTFEVPVQIRSDREFAIQSTNTNIVEWTRVSSKPKVESSTPRYTYPMGNTEVTYYVFGKGDLLVPMTATHTSWLVCNEKGSQYQVCTVDAKNEVGLFHGSELTGFKGKNDGSAAVQLAVKQLAGNDYNDLTEFKVDVTSSRFATSGSSVKRMIQAITVNPTSTASTFDRYVKTDNTATTTNPNNSFPFGTNTVNTATPINANIAKTCPSGIVTDLTPYIHNGNPNVYACKDGKLQIGAIAMTGVKTILVENADIVFTQNTKHADSNASWAFIAKDGNIVVKTNVTALEGVLMAIKSTTTTGTETKGEITGENSPKILRIDGMVYGNAKKLFENRTYVRGTNAYDTLTTGTIINYSNRSLRNVPPLLSQYLNAYNVQRVVR